MYSDYVFLQQRTINTPPMPSRSVEELIAVSVCVSSQQEEPKIVFEACQPFFRFSRKQVRQFADMLEDAQSLLLELYPGEREEEEWDDEAERRFAVADQMLATKINFVARSPSLHYPALLGIDRLIFDLSREELEMLAIEVSSHKYDLDIADAVCFYAVPPSFQGLQHLQTKELRNIRGQALCGAYPPYTEQIGHNIWLLLVCNNQPRSTKQYPLCPKCLDLWTRHSSLEKQNNK